MVKEGGSEDEAKTLAAEFQELVVEVMFEARAIKEENDIIRAKALPGTKKKEKANLPNEFVTNDDFCPGCGLELKSLPGDKVVPLRRHVPVRLRRQRRSGQRQGRGQARPVRVPRPVARSLARGGSPPLHRRAARRHQGARRRRCRAKYAYVHGVAGRREARADQGRASAAIRSSPATRCRGTSRRSSSTAIRRRSRRAAAGRSSPTRSCGSRSPCA